MFKPIQRYFLYFSMKTYVVTPHQNRLDETVLMMGHKICFYGELWLLIPKLSLLPLLIWSTDPIYQMNPKSSIFMIGVASSKNTRFCVCKCYKNTRFCVCKNYKDTILYFTDKTKIKVFVKGWVGVFVLTNGHN